MTQAYVISDLHLGNPYCRRDGVSQFLDTLVEGATLILNGDVIEHSDIIFSPEDLKLLNRLRSESRLRKVVWIRGNHDADFVLSDPGEIVFCTEYAIGKRLFVSHGDLFDNIMPRHAGFIRSFKRLYYLVQRLGGPRLHVAKYAKRFPGLYRILCHNVALNAVTHGRKNGYAAVTCGHTHFAEERYIQGIRYANTGSWTESPSHYLDIDEKEVTLKSWS